MYNMYLILQPDILCFTSTINCSAMQNAMNALDEDEDDSLYLPHKALEKSNFVVLYRPNQNWMELFKTKEFAAKYNEEHELAIDNSVVVATALDPFCEELVRYKKSGKYSRIFTEALGQLSWQYEFAQEAAAAANWDVVQNCNQLAHIAVYLFLSKNKYLRSALVEQGIELDEQPEFVAKHAQENADEALHHCYHGHDLAHCSNIQFLHATMDHVEREVEQSFYSTVYRGTGRPALVDFEVHEWDGRCVSPNL